VTEILFPSLRRCLLKVAEPTTKLLGKTVIPHRFALRDEEAAAACKLAEPGDIFTTRIDYAASNLVIPGFWKHAAMVVKGDRVVEAVGSGVRVVWLHDFIVAHDHALLLKSRFASPQEGVLAANFAVTLVGKPYDFLVEFSNDRKTNAAFYCSEIPWWCYDQVLKAEGKISPFTPRETLGMQTVTPQDYANATDKWQVKYMFSGK